MKDMHKSAKRSATLTVEARNRLKKQQVQHESVMRNVIKARRPASAHHRRIEGSADRRRRDDAEAVT